MYMNKLTPTQLIELKSITEQMVLSGNITESERIDFLAKAGLTKINNDNWISAVGTKYSFK